MTEITQLTVLSDPHSIPIYSRKLSNESYSCILPEATETILPIPENCRVALIHCSDDFLVSDTTISLPEDTEFPVDPISCAKNVPVLDVIGLTELHFISWEECNITISFYS